MKKIVLIFFAAIIFASCKSVESQQVSNSNTEESNLAKAEKTPLPETLLPVLSNEQKQNLDERLSPKVRQLLDEAAEINIYYDIDKETKELKIFWKNAPNSVAKLSDSSLKKRFLDAFYYDASSKELGNACFSPRHRITAKHKNKTVEIDICYQCSNFTGKSSLGRIGGGLSYENKSSSIMNEIIEKYGTDIQ